MVRTEVQRTLFCVLVLLTLTQGSSEQQLESDVPPVVTTDEIHGEADTTLQQQKAPLNSSTETNPLKASNERVLATPSMDSTDDTIKRLTRDQRRAARIQRMQETEMDASQTRPEIHRNGKPLEEETIESSTPNNEKKPKESIKVDFASSSQPEPKGTNQEEVGNEEKVQPKVDSSPTVPNTSGDNEEKPITNIEKAKEAEAEIQPPPIPNDATTSQDVRTNIETTQTGEPVDRERTVDPRDERTDQKIEPPAQEETQRIRNHGTQQNKRKLESRQNPEEVVESSTATENEKPSVLSQLGDDGTGASVGTEDQTPQMTSQGADDKTSASAGAEKQEPQVVTDNVVSSSDGSRGEANNEGSNQASPGTEDVVSLDDETSDTETRERETPLEEEKEDPSNIKPQEDPEIINLDTDGDNSNKDASNLADAKTEENQDANLQQQKINESSEADAPDGSLASFFEKVNNKKPAATNDTPQQNEAQSSFEKLAEQAQTKAAEAAPPEHNYSGTWGVLAAKTRVPDMELLYKVFERRVKESLGLPSDKLGDEHLFPLPIGQQVVEEEPDPDQKANQSGSGDIRDDAARENNDVKKFFQGVDPPEELDIVDSGSSMQDFIVGEGSQIVIKRVKLGVEFLKRLFQGLKSKIGEQLFDEDGNMSITFDDVSSAAGGVWTTFQGMYESVVDFVDDLFNKAGGSDDDSFDLDKMRKMDMSDMGRPDSSGNAGASDGAES